MEYAPRLGGVALHAPAGRARTEEGAQVILSPLVLRSRQTQRDHRDAELPRLVAKAARLAKMVADLDDAGALLTTLSRSASAGPAVGRRITRPGGGAG